MIDLYQCLLVFLSIVCAPAGTQEIGIFEAGGRSTYLVYEENAWRHYQYGGIQDYQLEMIESKTESGEQSVDYRGVGIIDGNEIVLTEKFVIPAELFSQPSGVYLIRFEQSTEVAVIRKFKEGIDIDPPSRRPAVAIRWKPKK